MATPFPASVSAVQVGPYFVGQYYHILQQQPDFVHQFYTESSTMLRVNGSKTETATAMMVNVIDWTYDSNKLADNVKLLKKWFDGLQQIHSLIMSLNFTGIEIKTAHSLESWNGGVLVMVSGSVQTKDFNGRRNFVQSFFLAPQENGYFVLNDIFHFLDDENIHQHPAATLAHGDFETKPSAPNPAPEPEKNIAFEVSEFSLGAEVQALEFMASDHVDENDTVDKYSIPESPQQVSEADNIVEETPAEEPAASYPVAVNTVRDPPPVPVEEPVGEPPKHTYASILRAAKGQSAHSVTRPASLNKSAPVASERYHGLEPSQHSYPVLSVGPDSSGAEAADEIAAPEEEGEGRSVYVRNLPSTVSASDVEQEFKNFGRIKLDGVVIRNRKDIGVCYAFIEFEDAAGVQNAIKASPIQFGGRQVHIEERRANSSSSRGGRRGRGRGGYQTEAPRGRFGGRTFGRGSGQDSVDRDYSNRPRGNGFHQRAPRGNQVSRNDGSNLSEASAS